MDDEKNLHPWGEFLKARINVILWMSEIQRYSDIRISFELSMNEEQVYLIRKHKEREIEKNEGNI